MIRTQHPDNTSSSRLDRKVVMVTGAAHGIGRAISEGFAGEGAALVLGNPGGEAVGEAAEAIRFSSGAEGMPIRVDVSERDDNGSMTASGLERPAVPRRAALRIAARCRHRDAAQTAALPR